MKFDWDFANLEHIALHKVEPEEAEEAVTDPAAIPGEHVHRGPRGERRFGLIGATEAGRVLFVVLEKRGEKFRVVTAYTAGAEERTAYYT
ncbi:hypothetical protein DEIPH_ctg008orf0130 [Deinococcus phoenicis]|uniref:BrnT family toxin n=1 Tax=Deinococcus phoenicis TaxID=1476583 RepID=A0A016QU25_9DEIO|nr:BrnT family toxin [Deinococcus phoenicis]EYB69397.1 hypothetical protein DEIPH_ctg008orf0130 [Deinococcus phoenicis]